MIPKVASNSSRSAASPLPHDKVAAPVAAATTIHRGRFESELEPVKYALVSVSRVPAQDALRQLEETLVASGWTIDQELDRGAWWELRATTNYQRVVAATAEHLAQIRTVEAMVLSGELIEGQPNEVLERGLVVGIVR